MKKIVFLFFILAYACQTYAQEIIKPNFAIASHPIIVEGISFTTAYLVVNLSLENKLSGGNFCLDQNTHIENILMKKKLKLVESKNIPICPEIYHFKLIGEKLNFQLYFPNPEQEVKYLNIIENCEANCLSIKGIILDPEMNKRINRAFKLFDEGSYLSSETTLLNIIGDYPDYNFGFLYLNLIQVLLVQEKLEKADEYLQVVLNSNFQDKVFVLEQLNKYDELKL